MRARMGMALVVMLAIACRLDRIPGTGENSIPGPSPSGLTTEQPTKDPYPDSHGFSPKGRGLCKSHHSFPRPALNRENRPSGRLRCFGAGQVGRISMPVSKPGERFRNRLELATHLTDYRDLNNNDPSRYW